VILYAAVVIARIVLAPLILLEPLGAIILSFFLDVVDADFACAHILKKTYQKVDKIVDYWTYIFQMIFSFLFLTEYKYVLLGFFLWRTLGMIIFLSGKPRKIFFIFANYFENLFLFLFFATYFRNANYLLDRPFFEIILFLIFVLKIFQEWFIHIANLSVRKIVFGSERKWKK